MPINQPISNTLAPIWQRIDRIYCISLEDRGDRRIGSQAEFNRVGLTGKVEYHIAQRHPGDCEQGIFESHQACLKKGLDAGARHILVFEDDVGFGRIDPSRLTAGIDFFMETDCCQALFLGCLCEGSRATTMRGVRRIRYRCLAHAYLVRRQPALRIADAPWRRIPYDTLLKKMIGQTFALYPSIAFQNDSPSDNARHRTLDRFRRRLGGLRFIQAVNERYHRFRAAVLAAHGVLVGALIWWILNR